MTRRNAARCRAPARFAGALFLAAGCTAGPAFDPLGPPSVTLRSDRSLPLDVHDVEIPPHFFGMHVVSAGAERTVWPPVNFGLYRLVNATPRWHHLSVSRNHWSDDASLGTGMSRIAAVLHFRDVNGPAVPALYTLAGGPDGGFPKWLKAAKADTLVEWRRFVREVATRFDGRIRYWEIWNEPDCECFYRGSVPRLVELTRIAADELRAINPANVIISPAFTDTGLEMMEAFLKAGGGRHVDVIAWHQTNHWAPERDTVRIRAVRSIMQRHGVAHLPLWTTEGHARLNAGGDAAAIVARTYLVLWAYGVRSFSWYAWDIYDYGTDFPGPWVTLVHPGARDVPAPAGVAYGQLARWLIGSRMTDLAIDGDVWTVTITMASGRRAWIVWHTGDQSHNFAVPPGVTAQKGLDGSVVPWSSPVYGTTPRPVLFM